MWRVAMEVVELGRRLVLPRETLESGNTFQVIVMGMGARGLRFMFKWATPPTKADRKELDENLSAVLFTTLDVVLQNRKLLATPPKLGDDMCVPVKGRR